MKQKTHTRLGAFLGFLVVVAGVLAVFSGDAHQQTPRRTQNEKRQSSVWKANALAADASDDQIAAAHAESERVLHDVVRPGIKDLRPGLGEAWTTESVSKVVDLIKMRNSSLQDEKAVIQMQGQESQYHERIADIEKHIDDNIQTIFRFQIVTAAHAESDRVLREVVRPGIDNLKPKDGEDWSAANAQMAADLVRQRNSALEDERAAILQNGYADSHDDRLNRIAQIIADNEDAIRRFEQIADEAAGKEGANGNSPWFGNGDGVGDNASGDSGRTTEDEEGGFPGHGGRHTPDTPDATNGEGTSPSHRDSGNGNTPTPELAENTCGRVLRYHFESIDPRFGISEADARGLFTQAEALWEGQTGKNLFVESEGSSLPVRFVYGQNQEDYNILDSMRVEIDADQSDYRAAVQLYRDLVEQYRSDSSNQELVDRINALVDHIRRVGPLLNAKIDNFNRIGRQRGRMTLGFWFRRGNGAEGIDILVLQRDALKRVRLVAHELGHALGLDHVIDKDALMYELNSGDDDRLRKDDLDELDRVCQLREARRPVHNGAEREEVVEVW